MHLRVHRQRVERATALARLSAASIPARPHPTVESAVILEQPVDVATLPGFASGDVSVQDASAQVAAFVVAPEPGERILDACAAPGGKTCHLAEYAASAIELVATDISDHRLARVAENRERLGFDFPLLVSDARRPAPSLEHGSFDAILVDAPCSATGVLRRHPDVKVIRRPTDIGQFAELQRELLAGVWPLLKPGGRLIYATCSLLRAENDDIVAWALAHLPRAKLCVPEHPHSVRTRHGIQCLPSPNEGDGLYYARIRKGVA